MTSTPPPLAEAMKSAELIHDRAAVEAATRRMATAISADYAGSVPVFLTIMNGGMFFAAQLALQLDVDAEFDYLHASRYRGATQGEGLNWYARPRTALAGKRVLLVDDILDEGPTLEEVRRWCLSQKPADVRIAVMSWKRHGRAVAGLQPDYWGLEVPDRYVFGYGMDYYEQGRNLPAIYALP